MGGSHDRLQGWQGNTVLPDRGRIIYNGLNCLMGVGVDISDRIRAEKQYRTLFEHAPDGLLVADANSRYIDANPSMCRLLGYSHEELVTLHRADIVSTKDMPQRGEGAGGSSPGGNPSPRVAFATKGWNGVFSPTRSRH